MDYEQNLDALLAKIANQEYVISVHTFATDLQGTLEFAQELFNRGGRIWQNECKRVVGFLRQIEAPLASEDSMNAPFEEILLMDVLYNIHQKILQLIGFIEDFSRDCEGSSPNLQIKLQKILKTLDSVMPQVNILADKLLCKINSFTGKTIASGQENGAGPQETIPQPPKDLPLDVIAKTRYEYLPSGIMNLYTKETMPLLEYTCINNTSDTIQFILNSFIDGFSSVCTDNALVEPHSQKPCYQLPLLIVEEAKKLTEIRRAVVKTMPQCLKNGSEHLLAPQDFDIYLMARNVIRWAVPDVKKGSGYIPLLEHIAAWVTPRVDLVKEIVREAADNNPKLSMSGYPASPDPQIVRMQVKAIFLTLKTKVDIAYAESTFAIGPNSGEKFQAVRLPGESLAERSANCIDGAVLYASLIERANFEPVIVIQKGHAFVGWKTHKSSKKHADEYEFLETTMSRTASFEDACDQGMKRYQQLVDDGWFQREVFDPTGFARLLDIKHLHDNGIYPME